MLQQQTNHSFLAELIVLSSSAELCRGPEQRSPAAQQRQAYGSSAEEIKRTEAY
jgi:hypothetical protein